MLKINCTQQLLFSVITLTTVNLQMKMNDDHDDKCPMLGTLCRHPSLQCAQIYVQKSLG